MKSNIHYILCMVLGILCISCKKDNYQAPGSSFQGRLVYKGEPINVSYNDVYFELWEPGWGKNTPITVSITQEGNFSALLFDASYKLVIPASQGPFRSVPDKTTNTDTMLLHLTGSQTMDIEVMPYYMIRTPKFAAAGKTITATCAVEKIITDINAKDIERVYLYIGKTQFVDGRTTLKSASIAGADITNPAAVSLQVDVPDITPAQHYVFARIGVKVAGVEDMIFSTVQQIEGI
ncbi:DUF3823 domain-containing protein [Chitinophaga sp. MM2321]|uniref:DUF3823 domain-containing protein n=1 Tax=Chitinophaga sp. MM2321 TaxID=3137178 RepID=UPI0032D5864D